MVLSLFLLLRDNEVEPAGPEVPSSRVNVSPAEDDGEDDIVVNPEVEEQDISAEEEDLLIRKKKSQQ